MNDAFLDTIAKPSPGPRPMILVADDEAPVRELLSSVLSASGFEVHAVENGAQAAKLATILRFDAAVIDLAMPLVTSGLNLLSWFRWHRSYGTFPILIFTGQTALNPDVEAMIRRNHAYVFYKSHPLRELVEHLTRLTAPPGRDLVPAAA